MSSLLTCCIKFTAAEATGSLKQTTTTTTTRFLLNLHNGDFYVVSSNVCYDRLQWILSHTLVSQTTLGLFIKLMTGVSFFHVKSIPLSLAAQWEMQTNKQSSLTLVLASLGLSRRHLFGSLPLGCCMIQHRTCHKSFIIQHISLVSIVANHNHFSPEEYNPG